MYETRSMPASSMISREVFRRTPTFCAFRVKDSPVGLLTANCAPSAVAVAAENAV
jgi:hypothetical protein